MGDCDAVRVGAYDTKGRAATCPPATSPTTTNYYRQSSTSHLLFVPHIAEVPPHLEIDLKS